MPAFALLLLALVVVAIVVVLVRRPRRVEPAPVALPEPAALPKVRAAVVAEAAPVRARISGEVEPPRPSRPALVATGAPARSTREALDTLDALLTELESTTVRIDGPDAFDEASVADLEGLAGRLEAAAEALAST